MISDTFVFVNCLVEGFYMEEIRIKEKMMIPKLIQERNS